MVWLDIVSQSRRILNNQPFCLKKIFSTELSASWKSNSYLRHAGFLEPPKTSTKRRSCRTPQLMIGLIALVPRGMEYLLEKLGCFIFVGLVQTESEASESNIIKFKANASYKLE